jgi:Rnl2 family RNA ligase
MFKKYPSMNNHYHTKNIQYWVNNHPELNTTLFVIQEKIHGANIQLDFNPNEEKVLLGKRTNYTSDNFYNIKEALITIDKQINTIYQYCKNTNTHIILYGEIYGANIQKGVDYGPDRKVIFYDLVIDDIFMPLRDFYTFAVDYCIPCVPILGFADGITEALDFNVNINSLLTPKDNQNENICEGGVIKPWNITVQNKQDNYNVFKFKKKNEKFKEIQQSKKPIISTLEGEAKELAEIFKTYINKQRVDNVISKEGPLESMSQFGKYIKLVLEDAKQEFFIEYGSRFRILTNNEKKQIINSGKEISKLLQDAMNQ